MIVLEKWSPGVLAISPPFWRYSTVKIIHNLGCIFANFPCFSNKTLENHFWTYGGSVKREYLGVGVSNSGNSFFTLFLGTIPFSKTIQEGQGEPPVAPGWLQSWVCVMADSGTLRVLESSPITQTQPINSVMAAFGGDPWPSKPPSAARCPSRAFHKLQPITQFTT